MRVERTGAERVFQRIGQEYASNIHAVDVVNSSDAAHFIVWKRDGILAPYVPEDVAKFYPAEHKDADGQFASFRVWLSIIAYNTNLVKAEDAPKSFADLLDPKWKGKIVKAHPGYSGTIMTATFQMARDLGWDYFEKLAKQNIMQVQSSADPPKKLALGERAVMADGNEYNIFQIKEEGGRSSRSTRPKARRSSSARTASSRRRPTRTPRGCSRATASRRNASSSSSTSAACARCIRRPRRRPGRKPFKEIKTMKDDAAGGRENGRRDQGALRQSFSGFSDPSAFAERGMRRQRKLTRSRRDVLKGRPRRRLGTAFRRGRAARVAAARRRRPSRSRRR